MQRIKMYNETRGLVNKAVKRSGGVTTMEKVKQSKKELLSHLEDIVGFIEASSIAFDVGKTGEAKRLAVSIRVLLHDTNNSKSLLGLLGWKDGHSFLNSAIPYDARNLVSHHGLVGLRIGGDTGGSYHAPLGDGPPSRPYKYVKFPDWWNENVIVDSKKQKFNRRELILSLSNKDGGAHVDPELDESYANLTRNNSVGWITSNGAGEEPLMDVEKHSVRQIAYEVMESIARMKSKHGV